MSNKVPMNEVWRPVENLLTRERKEDDLFLWGETKIDTIQTGMK
jgi:hypothetical protein